MPSHANALVIPVIRIITKHHTTHIWTHGVQLRVRLHLHTRGKHFLEPLHKLDHRPQWFDLNDPESISGLFEILDRIMRCKP